ncbi:hypothetical protein [Stenotrophomonas sp. GZD-301]|uniref:hypothetical protein n=1 Tax=Stenotrophomonas sp. GZD-301 TaxID=3404814 RepID=UPI003BB7A063
MAAMAEAPTVASTMREMRRAGAAGEPVPADAVQIWVQTFMTLLYGTQAPVRYERRRLYSTEPWQPAEMGDVQHRRRRNLEIRALYVHPPVEKLKDHRWPADGDGDCECLDCGESRWLSDEYCKPFKAPRERRDGVPFDPRWVRAALEKLIDLTKHTNTFDRHRWRTEATYQIERIDQYEKARRG